MTKNSITLYGTIGEDLKFTDLHMKNIYEKSLKNRIGQSTKIEISEAKQIRSLSQNSYYWGIVLPIITNALNEYGNNFDNEEVHIWLKTNAVNNMTESAYLPNGTVSKKIKSTRKLSKQEFSDYIEQIKAWAIGFNIIIPDATKGE